MSENTYTCPFHHTEHMRGAYCPECMEDFKNLPDPATMKPEERVAEIEHWDGVLTVEWDTLKLRLMALTNSDSFTHEYADIPHLKELAARPR